MRRFTKAGAIALAALTVALFASPGAGATTYNNDAPIIIPEVETANPYPSTITVSGTAGPITDVNVGLDGLSHTAPNDLSVVLVAPTGQALLLADCVGGTGTAAGVFITLDDAAAGKLPDGPLSTGTFQPTSHCAVDNSFPAPGPLTTYANPGPERGGIATFASTFNGSSAIGTWNLFVIDRFAGDSGSIPGGWSLDVHPDVTPPAPAPTPTPAKKKCKKKKGKKATAAAKGCKKKKKKR